MATAIKTCAALFTILVLTSLVTVQIAAAQPNNSSAAPGIVWQQQYHDSNVLIGEKTISNIVQTSDGGFAFLSLGYFHYRLIPATLFKIDSTGKIEWTKKLDNFTASKIIQTKDGGYEISGNWRVFSPEPTVITTDSKGNILSV